MTRKQRFGLIFMLTAIAMPVIFGSHESDTWAYFYALLFVVGALTF